MPRWMSAAAVFLAVLAVSACADPRIAVPLNDVPVAAPVIPGSVYLIRGGFNIFSTGMD